MGFLFGSKGGTVVAPPPLAPPPPMPTPDDKAVKDADRRAKMAKFAMRGRESTVLAQDYSTASDKLG